MSKDITRHQQHFAICWCLFSFDDCIATSLYGNVWAKDYRLFLLILCFLLVVCHFEMEELELKELLTAWFTYSTQNTTPHRWPPWTLHRASKAGSSRKRWPQGKSPKVSFVLYGGIPTCHLAYVFGQWLCHLLQVSRLFQKGYTNNTDSVKMLGI